jgi:hypothetical protein
MVTVEMKYLTLDGRISSDGFPINADFVQSSVIDGGSGGHISIKFTSTTAVGMKLGRDAIIQAIGGFGINSGQSGSGGRIVM